ncbi:MAG: VIT domain-containing protein [Chloroflexaceae bacterium]
MSAIRKPELYPSLPITEGMLVPMDRTLPPVPLKHTAVRANIIGPLCDVEVTQQFHNTHTRPVEALYVFPLPEDAAVTALTLTIGERVIQGEVREREQAQRDYAEARDAGQGAALLEQERPNLFSIAVADIQPDAQVQVTLRFHDRVPYDNGGFEFVFPTVVLPRYLPPDQDTSEDAQRMTATPLLPEATRDGHTLSLEVTLDTGKLETINSPTHDVETQLERGRTRVTLRQADAIPNQDFILRYRPAGKQFATAAFTYRPAGKPGTLLLMLTPQAEVAPEDVVPRELLFVYDRSGSMGGDSIVQARNALRACLRALNPGDTFNIFPFDNRVELFAPQPLPFTQENVDRADAYLEQINARGGTEILKALQTALDQPRDAERLRVVVFMTDGAVGNEEQVLRALRRSLNEARVYAFGIGSAVNRYLLDKLAEVGRGSVEYIFPGQAIEEAVQRFQNRAAFPVLVDLAIDWGGARVADVYPDPLPDLYAGQPLTLLARFHSSGHAQIRLTGRTPQGSYAQTLELEWPTATPDRGAHWATLPQVWARARLDALLTRERDFPEQQSKLRQEIISLALEYNLLSPYTAFVAIEQQQHPEREAATPVRVPIHLPQGTWRAAFEPNLPHGASVGHSGQSAAPGAMFLSMAAPPPSPASSPAPQGRARRSGMLQRIGDTMTGMFGSQAQSPAPAQRAETGADWLSGSAAQRAGSGDQPAARGQADLPAETRYDLALRYLARTQSVSGAWDESSVATALVLLACLRGGHSDRAGNFRPQLTRAVRWLVAQASNASVAPVVAWALAELAAQTGAAAHAAARDAALAHATPVDALDQACLTLAQARAAGKSFTPDQDIPLANPQATLANLDERGALALALALRVGVDAAADLPAALATQQQPDGRNAGAVVPAGHTVDQPTSMIFAATAVGAMAWHK